MDMEKARAGYMVAVGVCIDLTLGNTLCNFKIYLFILVFSYLSSKSTLRPLAQTLTSLSSRVGRPRSMCRQIPCLVIPTLWSWISVFSLASFMVEWRLGSFSEVLL